MGGSTLTHTLRVPSINTRARVAGGSAGSATGTGVATKWSGNNDNSVEERRGRGEMTGSLPSGAFLSAA